MTTDRTEEGVRVRVKIGDGRRTGTALYGPYGSSGRTMPGFDFGQWRVPVRMDHNGEVWEYATTDLEPGPRRFRELGDRRVRSKADSSLYGTLLPDANVRGVRWPGFDHSGRLKVPVSLDGGMVVAWRVDDLEQAPWPEPVSVFEEPPPGPRVMVMGTWTSPKAGRVLYRMKGDRYPGFDEHGYWRVPVQVDDGPLIYPRADQLDPEPAEPKQASGPAPRLILSPREAEATILAEADKVANAIQAKALREVAGAAADALELFASRLRDIELDGGER